MVLGLVFECSIKGTMIYGDMDPRQANNRIRYAHSVLTLFAIIHHIELAGNHYFWIFRITSTVSGSSTIHYKDMQL